MNNKQYDKEVRLFHLLFRTNQETTTSYTGI